MSKKIGIVAVGLLLALSPFIASAQSACSPAPVLCPTGETQYYLPAGSSSCTTGGYVCESTPPLSQPSSQTSSATPAITSASGVAVFSSPYALGGHGAAVLQIQNELVALGLLDPSDATGYFGQLTQSAIETFQSQDGIVSSGTGATTGFGVAGPRTRAALAAAVAGQGTGTAGTTGTTTPPTANTSITSNTTQSSSGPSVTASSGLSLLQSLLAEIQSLQSQMTALTSGAAPANTTQANTTTTTNAAGSCPAVIPPACTGTLQPLTSNGCVNAFECITSSVTTTTQAQTQTVQTTATPQSCTFNGQSVASGSSVTGFQSSSVPFGSQCVSGTLTCTNGTLSNASSFPNASCAPATAASCSFNGQSIQSGGTATGFQAASVAAGGQCVSGTLTCTNGTLSNASSFPAASCSVAAAPQAAAAASCTFNNQSVASGASVNAFQSSSVAFGSSCQQQTRTCSNGTLSGTFTAATCSVAAAQSCTFNGQSVASGATVTAFQAASVAAGSQCVSGTLTCTNGVLSNASSFPAASCSVAAAPQAAAAASAPTISSFAASPASITSGQSSTLTWNVSPDATSVVISGVGNVTQANVFTTTALGRGVNFSTVPVSPTQTTTYTLTASNGSASASAQTTVTVAGTTASATGPSSPSLTVSPTTVAPGDSLTLTVSDPNNAGKDWIGLYPTSSTNSCQGDSFIQYLNTSGLSGSAITNTTLTLTAPTTLGTYYYAILANGLCTVLVTSSQQFTVSSSQSSSANPLSNLANVLSVIQSLLDELR